MKTLRAQSQLSIAIFGNTNNFPLLMAQGLKLLGHRVRLVLNRKEILHRPEARYPEWADNYPEWVVDCSYLSDDDIAFETPAIDRAIHELTYGVDIVILNDVGPSLASYIRAPYIAMLTGSDLAYYANFDSLPIITSTWDPNFKRSLEGRRHLRRITGLISRQRDGILGAELIVYPQRGLVPPSDKILDGIGVSDARRLMVNFSNTIDLLEQPAASNSRLSILSGARIVYDREQNPGLGAIDFKGTDVLLKGFAIYCKRGGSAELKLPRKGQDLKSAVDLVSQLGLEKRVLWLEEMPLVQFYQEMIAADLICDQFGSSIPGMVTMDAYALGRPVMAKFRNDVFRQRYPAPLPGFDAESPEEIADHLVRIEEDRALLTVMGRRSRNYAVSYLAPERMAMQVLEKMTGLING